MTQEDFLVRIASALNAAGIPFMITGSHASSYHGRPRSTNDADLVIQPTAEQLDSFLATLGPDFYVSADAARDALQRRSLFNVIAVADGWKADLIVCKDRPFSAVEFQRRRMEPLLGRLMPVASPEDVILSKLEWSKITPSARQVQDALDVMVAQGSTLDREYLRRWAAELGVARDLDEVEKMAKTLECGGI